MRYSKLFGKTVKIAPKEAEIASHKLLVQGGFVDQLGAGIYTFLPLGWRVHQKIAQVIRAEMDAVGAQELGMPVLQPKNIWLETGRWDRMDPPLFKLTDRHDKELALGSTHEEVITDLVRERVQSYKDLPLVLYQIQVKFRNEMRSTGGLLRVREFVMKDLYSFHESEEDLSNYHKQVSQAYKKIFNRCGLDVIVTQASGGTIGGAETYEYNVLCDAGENEIIYCPGGDYAANAEVSEVKEGKECDLGHGKLLRAKTIEVGHTFSLGTKYSEAMGAFFTDFQGRQKPIQMGCYGIGVGRLMATIVEVSHDAQGIIWPAEVAPYQAHLLVIRNQESVIRKAEDVYKRLCESGVAVLYDDRDVPAGEKFADSDLLGIPVRLVVSEKTGDKVEWKNRAGETVETLTLKETIRRLEMGGKEEVST